MIVKQLIEVFDILDSADACPIFGLLFEGPDQDRFRAQAERSFDRIIAAAASYGQALGMAVETAHDAAETFIIGFQGSWTLARTRRKSDILRSLPARLYGPA